jgi:hypothetical protein
MQEYQNRSDDHEDEDAVAPPAEQEGGPAHVTPASSRARERRSRDPKRFPAAAAGATPASLCSILRHASRSTSIASI